MKKRIYFARHLISHLLVALIAFQFGTMMASTRCVSTPPISTTAFAEFRSNLNMAKLQRRNQDAASASHAAGIEWRKNVSSISGPSAAERKKTAADQFVHHISWVPREEFTKQFDLGIPIENVGAQNKNHSVLLLHTTKSSNQAETRIQDPLEATEQCQDLSIVIIDRKRKKRCIAIMENWGGSSHIYRFWRNPKAKDTSLLPGGRFHSENPGGANRWQKPPPRSMTQKSWKLLKNYLNHYDATLEALKPIASKIASAGSGPASDEGAIIVMVSNFGQSEILFNFVCAAHKINYDLSKVLLFPMDEQTNALAQQLGLQTFFAKQLYDGLIPTVKHDGYTFGDGKFAAMMMSKVYSVQMINDLGYDVLFQDLDVVPLRPNVLDYFYEKRNTEEVDLFFQYDRNHNIEQAPFSANSGFYFAKYNQRTNYYFTMLARMGDLILKTGSHQQVMANLMSDHIATHGLKVKVMGGHDEDADLFPNGWHMHRSKTFMNEMKQGIQQPYIFHMNWNNNGKEKIDLMKETGYWFVSDTCHPSDPVSSISVKGCCVAL